MGIIFASYGNSEKFYKTGHNSSLKAPEYLKNIGLNGYEYLCNQGVHISDDSCEILKENSQKNGIFLSVRGYDFISMSEIEEEKQEKNLDIIKETIRTAHKIGADRIVLPLDNCAIKSRDFVKKSTLKILDNALSDLKKEGMSDVFVALETMGLIHDYGTFSEVLAMCRENEMLMPCINAGNLYARNLGKEIEKEEFEEMFFKIKKHLGTYRGNHFHIYCSKVEYTNQGFKDNVDFCEKGYENQNFNNLIDAVISSKITPFIVAKSPTMSDCDVLQLKNYYMKKSEKNV